MRVFLVLQGCSSEQITDHLHIHIRSRMDALQQPHQHVRLIKSCCMLLMPNI